MHHSTTGDRWSQSSGEPRRPAASAASCIPPHQLATSGRRPLPVPDALCCGARGRGPVCRPEGAGGQARRSRRWARNPPPGGLSGKEKGLSRPTTTWGARVWARNAVVDHRGRLTLRHNAIRHRSGTAGDTTVRSLRSVRRSVPSSGRSRSATRRCPVAAPASSEDDDAATPPGGPRSARSER